MNMPGMFVLLFFDVCLFVCLSVGQCFATWDVTEMTLCSSYSFILFLTQLLSVFSFLFAEVSPSRTSPSTVTQVIVSYAV